jgi:predicted PurR-regulated permease PerM
MVVFPVAKKLKEWGVKWGLAVLLADLLIVLFITFMIFLLAAQGNKIYNNWPQIESRLKPKFEKAQNFLTTKLNMPSAGGQSSGESQQGKSPEGSHGGQQEKQGNQSSDESQPGKQEDQTSESKQQQQSASQQQNASSDKQNSQQQGGSSGVPGMSGLKTAVPQALKGIFGFLGDMLLMLVYIFFFLFYHKKFENAVKGLVPDDKREKAGIILSKSALTAQRYLFGRFLLIIILAVLYIISFSIIGLEYAVFISLLAAIFSLLPYIGNLIGLVLAIGMSSLSGGEPGQIIGIIIAFSIIQFIESYALEPFVVGKKVNINPVITIVGVVLGGVIWGVMGMLLAIPVIGILKVVLDNIETLRPLGYFLDERDLDNDNSPVDKIKDWVKKKMKK